MASLLCTTIVALLLIAPVWPDFAVAPANILCLFVNGQRSHQLVYAALVRLLLQRGHRVTLVTTAFDERLPRVGGQLRHIRLPSSYTDAGAQAAPTSGAEKLEYMLARIRQTSRFLDDPAWRAFVDDEAAAGGSFDLLLLGYLFNDYQLGVAAHFKCPVVVVWTAQPMGHLLALMGNPAERHYVTQPYDRHQQRGLGALPLRVAETAVEMMALHVMQSVYDEYFPSALYPPLSELRRNVSLALCNHHSISEGPIAPYVPAIVEIGGIQLWQDDATPSTMRLLDSPALAGDIVFFSLGSRLKWSTLPRSIAVAFADAFRQLSNVTVLWTYDDGDGDGDCRALTTPPATNIICAPWWPQSAILARPRLRLFITHGGKGSIAEALHHGVSMLGVPYFGDQHANIARMVRAGFGLRLDIDDVLKAPQTLHAALATLLQNRSFAANARRFSRRYRDRPLPANETALYWIEYVLRHKGAPHLRSGRLQLNAFESSLMDVVAVILLTFAIVRVACNRLERWLDGI